MTAMEQSFLSFARGKIVYRTLRLLEKYPSAWKLKDRFPLCCSTCNKYLVSHGGWEMLIILETSAIIPSTRHLSINHPLIDQSEGVIEHKIAARAVRKQLEDLSVIHRPFLIVNL